MQDTFEEKGKPSGTGFEVEFGIRSEEALPHEVGRQRNGVAGKTCDFAERLGQDPAKRGSAPGGEGVAGEDDREGLVCVKAEAGQKIERLTVPVGLGAGFPNNGRAVKISQAFDVAFDGALGDLEFVCECWHRESSPGSKFFMKVKQARCGGGAGGVGVAPIRERSGEYRVAFACCRQVLLHLEEFDQKGLWFRGGTTSAAVCRIESSRTGRSELLSEAEGMARLRRNNGRRNESGMIISDLLTSRDEARE